MEESWRIRSLPPSICPTCSFPHFPFCHPPPNFSHCRPPYDPMFPADFGTPPPRHLPPPLPPTPVRGQQLLPIPWRGVDATWEQRVLGEEMAQREGIHKRMRVDERGMSSFTQFQTPGPRRMGPEDERRLNLIRDHGQQQPTAQMNGHAFSDERFAPEGLNNQLGSLRNPEIDSLGRNGVVPFSDANSLPYSGGLRSHGRLRTGMHSQHGFDRNMDQEKVRISETEKDGNGNVRFNVVDKECGTMQYHLPDFNEQYSNVHRFDKGSWGQEPPNSSQEEYPRYHERQHQLRHGTTSPLGTTPPYASGYPAQVPLAVNTDNYRHIDSGSVYPMKIAGERTDQFHGHMGNPALPSIENQVQTSKDERVTQFEGQQYPIMENSRVRSSIDENRYMPLSSVDNVVVSMTPQVGNTTNQPSLTTRQLPILSELPRFHIEQTNKSPFMHQNPAKENLLEGNSFPLQPFMTEKPKIIDASHIFIKPHRATRPGHIAIILRGLPGSGKSYLAKVLRDLEVENGGSAPRVHSMDDYFMTEVEKKVEEADGTKSSSIKGKKPITKMVMEYCYEPEMEEAYRASMLRAFKKTVEEGIFTCVIVDDRNLRVADFAQFWAIGKSSGYEVYLLEATYKDPIGCAARNVHAFTLDDIQKMAEKWEEAPSLYLKIDIQPLFNGDKLSDHSILEVDMDTEDMACDENDVSLTQKEVEQTAYSSEDYLEGGRWAADEESSDIRELRSSKWSKNTDEDLEDKSHCKDHSNALSGLLQAYGKSGKFVHWGDQGERRGFSISAAKRTNVSSLIIGPGSGYNLNSNPISESDMDMGKEKVDGMKKHSIFLEHLRAEREAFKAVFDKRRHRIGGLHNENDD